MGVVLLAAAIALVFVIQGVLRIPVEGSVALFLAGAALHLFATTSLMATLARSMPQFGMLAALILLPLQLLSGNSTPRAKHAPVGAGGDAGRANHALRRRRLGHPVPRGRVSTWCGRSSSH